MADPVTVPVRNQASDEIGDLVLPTGLFDAPVRKHLLHEAVRMQLANRRAGTAATKTRGSVSGGGNKPWRQKGTGRARSGSNRSPVWVGGATVFGPQPRSYSYRMPRSARREALRSALSLRAREGRLVVLDEIQLDAPKTKVVAQMMARLGLPAALIVTGTQNVALERAARNLPSVKVLRAEGANVYDILRYPYLVLSRDALPALQERLTA